MKEVRSVFEKSKYYGRDKQEYIFYHTLFESIFEVLFFISGYLPYTWEYSGILVKVKTYFISVNSGL